MGTSPHLGVSGVHCTMRAVVFVLLGAVAINAEAEADSIIYYVPDIYYGLSQGAGAYNAPVSTANHDAGVHPVHHTDTRTPNYLWFAKREAEAEAEADPLLYHPTEVAHVGRGNTHPIPPHCKREAEADPLLYHVTEVAPVGRGNTHPIPHHCKREAEADPLMMYPHTGVAHVGRGNTHPIPHHCKRE